MQIDDLSPASYAMEQHTGVAVRAVGWLGDAVPRRGRLDGTVLTQLRHYRHVAFFDDGDLGYHTCQLCGAERGRGEFWVEWGGVRYVLPALVLHYCEVHDYLPPDQFLTALSARWTEDQRAR